MPKRFKISISSIVVRIELNNLPLPFPAPRLQSVSSSSMWQGFPSSKWGGSCFLGDHGDPQLEHQHQTHQTSRPSKTNMYQVEPSFMYFTNVSVCQTAHLIPRMMRRIAPTCSLPKAIHKLPCDCKTTAGVLPETKFTPRTSKNSKKNLKLKKQRHICFKLIKLFYFPIYVPHQYMVCCPKKNLWTFLSVVWLLFGSTLEPKRSDGSTAQSQARHPKERSTSRIRRKAAAWEVQLV